MRFLISLLLPRRSRPMAQDKPVLTVMTYDSFASEWGPGPVIEPLFEAQCGCDLQFQTAGDGAALLARLRLEGAPHQGRRRAGPRHLADRGRRRHRPVRPARRRPGRYDLPVAWDDPVFVPFDWGYFAFVYDKTKLPDPPASFDALAASDLKIVIEDPRSSTPGLGLLLWVKAAYRRPRRRDLGGARRQHRHRDAGLDRGLQPVPRRRGRHGAQLHHLAGLSPDRGGATDSKARGGVCRRQLPADRGRRQGRRLDRSPISPTSSSPSCCRPNSSRRSRQRTGCIPPSPRPRVCPRASTR